MILSSATLCSFNTLIARLIVEPVAVKNIKLERFFEILKYKSN